MIKVVQLDPNGLCNSKCWFCPVAYQTNPIIGKKNMPIDIVDNIFLQIKNGIGDFVDPNYNLFFSSHFNEILLYPDFEKLLFIYKKYNFPTVLFTNGVNLTIKKIKIINKYSSIVKHITLNIPSAFQKQWSIYTGFNEKIFNKLINNLNYAYKHLNKNINITIQVNNFNENSLFENGGTIEILTNAPNLNLDNNTGDLINTIEKFRFMYPNWNIISDNANIDRAGYLKNAMIFSNEKYLNKISNNGNKRVVGCIEKRAEEFLHINANGDVFLCCCDYNFETVFGNIYKQSIKEIWNSIEHKNMVNKSFSNFCTKCVNAIWE